MKTTVLNQCVHCLILERIPLQLPAFVQYSMMYDLTNQLNARKFLMRAFSLPIINLFLAALYGYRPQVQCNPVMSSYWIVMTDQRDGTISFLPVELSSVSSIQWTSKQRTHWMCWSFPWNGRSALATLDCNVCNFDTLKLSMKWEGALGTFDCNVCNFDILKLSIEWESALSTLDCNVWNFYQLKLSMEREGVLLLKFFSLMVCIPHLSETVTLRWKWHNDPLFQVLGLEMAWSVQTTPLRVVLVCKWCTVPHHTFFSSIK